MIVDVNKCLEIFISDRKDKFPKVTDKQKKKWIKNIETNIDDMLGDNDIFFDHIPEDVEEKDEYKII